jgi:hypothetical protein
LSVRIENGILEIKRKSRAQFSRKLRPGDQMILRDL